MFGNRKKYFLTEDLIPAQKLQDYSEQFIELDDEAQQVEDVLGDISDTSGIVTDDLTAARLENLRARTAVLQEKLEARKAELWSEWSAAFFDTFAEAFAKFKNEVISLHLNEEQLDVFHEKLDAALKVMQDRLEFMYNRFRNGEEEEEQK